MSKRRSSVQRVSNRKSKGSIRAFIPFVVGGLLLATIAGYMAIQPPPTDPKTFCPQNTENMGITALLIDVSDKLTNSQAAKLQNELKNISTVSEKRPSPFLKKGEKLVVYFVEPQGQVPSMIFSMCHPGDIANKTISDELTQGAIFARKKWEKFTDDVMVSIDKKINSSKEMATSPIFEAIQFIRAKNFPPPDVMNSDVKYRFVIWSDFLQNSDEGNHFRGLGDFQKILKRNPVELSGMELYLFQMISKKYSKYQTNEHVAWWRRVFAKTGAELNMWEKI